MKRGALAVCLLFVACGDGADVPDGASDTGAGSDVGGVVPDGSTEVTAQADAAADPPESPLPAACATDTTVPPRDLACTGLYTSVAGKQIANRVREFRPAVPLWSDGADKARWIYLPPGTQIDTSNPNEWIFPIGTKSWKEFSREGRRVETRLWQKVQNNFWVKATYAWNDDESIAAVSPGGNVTLPSGASYHIPTADECQQCHRGRTDRLLGFEHVSLGLPGAAGVTLEDLVAEGRLTHPPAVTSLSIGDDGTGQAAAPIAWMHINCGTTCHNSNSNAVAYAAGMNLRLDPTKLDGRSALDLESMKTTIGVRGRSATWNGRTRIVAGDAAGSTLFQLISSRGIANQMPPIATSIADEANDALMAAWINAMPPALPPPPRVDAGPPDTAPPVMDAAVDSGPDAPIDLGPVDAGAGEDVGSDDAGAGDSASDFGPGAD